MAIKIKLTGEFEHDLTELLADEPELEEQIDWVVGKFKENPKDSRLGVHKLTRKMVGKWAIEVTGDIRIIFKKLGRNLVRFLAIGGHEKVYGRKNN